MNDIKHKKIEIHTEEVNDILSRPPAWILRWGITLFFAVIAILFIGSVFFTYPDIIGAQVTISSTNMPVHLRAKSSGKIERFLVSDGDSVSVGSVVAMIESATDYHDVQMLRQLCNLFREDLLATETMEDGIKKATFPVHLKLGVIQSSYTQFLKSLSDYKSFMAANYHAQKMVLIRRQMVAQQEILHQGERQLVNYEEQVMIQQGVFARDSGLFVQGVIPEADLEQSRLKRLVTMQQYEGLKSSITNLRLTILQSEQVIFELSQEQTDRLLQHQNTLTGAFDNLVSAMDQWEQTNLIVSPINGKAQFSQYWQEFQNVVAGDLVLTIVPQEKSGVFGKLHIPLQGAGKVKVGQRVNIKLDNFPYMEFGMVEGCITHISAIPIEVSGARMMIGDVSFPKGLITNYNLQVESGEEMNGMADIITENISLFARFFNPIRLVLKSRIQRGI